LRVGLIDAASRFAGNAWRIPGLGRLLAWDYERSFARRPPNRFRGVFSSFAAAEASIPPGGRIGYDHAELAGLYRHRMVKACQSDYAVLFWLRGILGPRSFVFDFGGHVGVSYHGWRTYLDYQPGLRWLVCDFPAITQIGAALAAELSAPHLSFTNDPGEGRGCDVFLTAGALQYVDESLPAVLDRMGGPLPRHLIVNKMPLYDGESFVTVQSTGRAFHPYRIANRDDFVSGITGLGYRVIDDWSNREQSCSVPFTRGRDIDAYSGYYFRRD